MKKRILGVIAFAAVAIAAGWNYQQSKGDVELSELALENIEALAKSDVIQKDCPGGRHLCVWVNHTTYYDHNGPNDI